MNDDVILMSRACEKWLNFCLLFRVNGLRVY